LEALGFQQIEAINTLVFPSKEPLIHSVQQQHCLTIGILDVWIRPMIDEKLDYTWL